MQNKNGHSLALLLSSFSSKVSTNNDTISRRKAQNSRKLPHEDEDWRWSAEVSTNFRATRWVWLVFSAPQPSKDISVWRWRRHVHFDCLQRPVKRSECRPDWCDQFQWIRGEGIANHTETALICISLIQIRPHHQVQFFTNIIFSLFAYRWLSKQCERMFVLSYGKRNLI